MSLSELRTGAMRTGTRRAGRILAVVGLAASLVIAASASRALAVDSSLDPTFGGTGKVVSDFGFDDSAEGVVVQPDGRIVIAGTSCGGDFLAARYNPDGSLDTTFDGDGRVCIDVGSGSDDRAEEVLLLGDGRLLVAGSSGGDFALVRLSANGALDPTFGTGGKATYDFGGTDRLYDAALAPDGRVVLVGETTVPGCSFIGPTPGQTVGVAVARTTVDGSLDPDFDADGKVVLAGPEEVQRGLAVVVQDDGGVVVGGRAASCSRVRIDFLLLRLTPSGAPDPGFPTSDGFFEAGPDTVTDLAIQGDGKLLVAIDTFFGPATGPAHDDAFTVLRYNPGGTVDTSFGVNGAATALFGAGTNATARAVALHGDEVVVGGSVDVSPCASLPSCDGDFALARFNADGSPDTAFGGDGKAVTEIGGDDALAALAVQADSKVVAAGTTGSDVALSRYGTTATTLRMCGGQKATITGTPGDDTLVGTTGPDVIVGAAGNDTIRGLGGDDVICGSGGDDRIFAGPGDDRVFGNDGSDIVDGGPGNDELNGGRGARDVCRTDEGSDATSGCERVRTGSGGLWR